MANSVDLDETDFEPSLLELHCLQKYIFVLQGLRKPYYYLLFAKALLSPVKS